MNNMAYCGLICGGCPIYQASREENADRQRQMRIEIARKINETYQSQYKPVDVTDCDGCKAETGRLFTGCRKCEIRACARKRKLADCGQCDDYACDPLEKMFQTDPEIKTRLDGIRSIHL
jgi:hypothetical protein